MHQPRRISISRPAERCTDWANTANPQGQVTQETFGNGLVVNHAFDAVTGWLGTITAGAGGGSALQNNSYLFDYVGNLTQRQDNNPGAHRERLSRCAQPQIRALADGRRARHGGEPSSRPELFGIVGGGGAVAAFQESQVMERSGLAESRIAQSFNDVAIRHGQSAGH
jgi:hypothetical protein